MNGGSGTWWILILAASAFVLISILGRATPVELDFDKVKSQTE